MRRFFLFASLLAVAAPVYAFDANLQMTLAQWQSLRDPEAPGIVFNDGIRFLAEHPGWPDEKIIRTRTEAAALFERPDRGVMAGFCDNVPPITGRGMLACVRVKSADPEKIKSLVHQAWIQGDFTEAEERTSLDDYAGELTQTDHLARMDRVLFEHKLPAAKRMLLLVPKSKHALYTARMAVISHDNRAPAQLRAVPPADKRDPGLLYDCITAALENHKIDLLVKLVKLAPANVPYPDLWWPARNTVIREEIAHRDFATALSLLAKHGDLKGEGLADALWLKGWITLESMHKAGEAYKEFHALYTQVQTPVSRARAAYWAARAAAKNGNDDIAHDWLVKAAKYGTVFYGQLAQASLAPNTPLDLPDTPKTTVQDKAMFEKNELVRVTRMLDESHDEAMRDRFLRHLANSMNEPGQLKLTADLARELDGVSGGVKAAKISLRQQVVLLDAGWPHPALPPMLGVEPALTLAITRQESEFDVHAQSAANARGLMQLLPSTARHVAERNDWHYSDASLDNPSDNMLLGSAYLGSIIRGFDGSYILGIASYNAGPATVRKWIAERGAPPKTVNGAVNWVESIPYAETRNYVMRVLENTQVYRGVLDADAPLVIEDDLRR